MHRSSTHTCGRALLLFLLLLLRKFGDLEKDLLQGRVDDPVTADTEAVEILIKSLEKLLKAALPRFVKGKDVMQFLACLSLEVYCWHEPLDECGHG